MSEWTPQHGPRGRELAAIVVAPQGTSNGQYSIAVIVGTAFFVMNQLGVILDGRADRVGLGQRPL